MPTETTALDRKQERRWTQRHGICQVCGRDVAVLKDGTSRPHKPSTSARSNYEGHYVEPCRGSRYRNARWPVGQRLWHHTSGLWEIAADLGGEYGDYRVVCLGGMEKGRSMIGHGEYMHRHGWTAESELIEPEILRGDGDPFLLASNETSARHFLVDYYGDRVTVDLDEDGWMMNVGWDRDLYERKRDFEEATGCGSWWEGVVGKPDDRETKGYRRAWRLTVTRRAA